MEGIKGINNQTIEQLKGALKEKGSQEDFSKILKDAIKKTDDLQKEADKAIQGFVLKKTSLHETMIAIEKANLSFQLMLQVRNKIVNAYEEIMKVQV